MTARPELGPNLSAAHRGEQPLVDAAVAAERERCARIADKHVADCRAEAKALGTGEELGLILAACFEAGEIARTIRETGSE